MCIDMNVPFLGSIPLDPRIARACDEGKNFIHEFSDSEASKAYVQIIKKIVEKVGKK